MDNTIFAQSVARIKYLETKMIDRQRIESLVEAKQFSDCVRILQDTMYNEYVGIPSYEEGLKHALNNVYSEMYKISPVKEVVQIMAIRYDGHNIKSLFKGKLAGIDTANLTIAAGSIPIENLISMIKEENFRYMPKILRVHTEKALEEYKNTQDPQKIDIEIDKGIYAYMLDIARSSGMEYLVEITRLIIDIINIKTFVRVKLQDKGREFLRNVYISGGHLDSDVFGGNINDSLENFPNRIMHTNYYKWVKDGITEYIKDGDLGSVEKYGDNYLVEYLKKAKLISFGPEPLIAYIISRENEIRILRIILTGKKNVVSPEIIRGRLREIYV